MLDLRSFFDQLKRRKVVRTAIAYGVGAGGVLSIADIVWPAFASPSGIPMPQVPHYDVRGRLEVLLQANRRRGVEPDYRTGRTRWPTLDDVPLDVRERVG